MKEFKIRCSAISEITGGSIGLTASQELRKADLEGIPKLFIGLTDKQQEQLDKLSDSYVAGKITPKQDEKRIELAKRLVTHKELTETQQKELNELIHKEKYPELPEGLKTHCKKWLKRELTGKSGKNISNKYTEKGTVGEDDGIDLIADYHGYGMLFKNTKRYVDDPDIEGEPDILPEGIVIDNKSSWDIDTFPLFEDVPPTKGYVDQLLGYMAITGRPKAQLSYTLIDTPENLIEAQAWKECKDLGIEELDAEVFAKVKHELTFSDVPMMYRVKSFQVERDDVKIQFIRDRVAVCRGYIKNVLLKKLPETSDKF